MVVTCLKLHCIVMTFRQNHVLLCFQTVTGIKLDQIMMVPVSTQHCGFCHRCKSDIITELDACQPCHNIQDHQNSEDANVYDRPSSSEAFYKSCEYSPPYMPLWNSKPQALLPSWHFKKLIRCMSYKPRSQILLIHNHQVRTTSVY